MTDKTQEEFETWYEGVTGLPVEFNDAGIPVSIGSALSETVTMGMWVAWRASRESQCVNLPDSERSVDCGDVLYRSDVEQALDDAGVHYK